VGVAILADVNWRAFRLGRGEWETIAASILFGGQILLLANPRYSHNNTTHFSLVMFAVTALACLPVALLTTPRPADWLRIYNSVPALGMLGILVLFCTLVGCLLMNRWQRHVTATEAGLIYCIEPLFASLLALFLPAWLSVWAAINYANERATVSLLIGGGLITAANVLIQLPARRAAKVEP
jgi:drug/metabolite transporter (DMT)-like permease